MKNFIRCLLFAFALVGTMTVQAQVAPHATGIDGTTVYLNDLEDHSWSYYSDPILPAQMRSLNPIDITITYYGYGTNTVTTTSVANAPANSDFNGNVASNAVAVSATESANTFVYYKTLENADPDGTGNYPYTLIPNPFSKRPTSTDNGSQTITPTTREIHLTTTGSYTNNLSGTLTVTYTNASGNEASETVTIGRNTNDTRSITAKVGTTIRYSLSRTSNNGTVRSVARYDANNGTQIWDVSRNNSGTSTNSYIVAAGAGTPITYGVYRGFYAWRVKSMSDGLSIKVGGTTYSSANVANGIIIPAEEEVEFVSSNSTGNEIQFEALWAQAYVVTSNAATGLNPDVSYERNFVVTTTAITAGLAVPVTYSTRNPDGSGGSNNTVTLNTSTLNADTKFEYINLTGGNTVTANNHYLCFGRGISTANNAGTVKGINANFTTALEYTLRLESGNISRLTFVDNTNNRTVNDRLLCKSILGCDYDRANEDNSKLSISASNDLFFGLQLAINSDLNKYAEVFNCVVKSGSYQSNYWNEANNNKGDYQHSLYCGVNQAGTNTRQGIRNVTIEGGELGSVCGGRGVGQTTTTNNDPSTIVFNLRIKGGLMHGCVYGAAADNPSIGSRRFVITGGTIEGWIAGGTNGTAVDNLDRTGATNGDTYVYVGGNVLVGGANVKSVNSTPGGQVFGAGRGEVTKLGCVNNSNVVIADNSTISNPSSGGNVYGGGYNGYITETSNVYIVGGTVEGKVFGGAYGNDNEHGNNRDIPTANVTMKGGLVTGGVYGGSNSTGVVNTVTIQIDGGQVGVDDNNRANIHGGGYGQNTVVNGNVTLNIGSCDEGDAIVFGDVYGGSALGNVNANNNTKTIVNLKNGTIFGALYGGALGDVASLGAGHSNVPASVRDVEVVVTGGSVKTTTTDPQGVAGSGSVFGCNNVNGTPSGTVKIDIYKTDAAPGEGQYALHAVYGGGNKSAYAGIPQVTVHGCDASIEYVYGGGNATDVRGTNVTIWGGTIGSAFGGGNGAGAGNPGANITADGTTLVIHGGTIGSVFGGSNERGKISSSVSVTIVADVEDDEDPCTRVAYTQCPMEINEMYSGGNEAELRDMEGHWITPGNINVTTDCSTVINYLFGGARKADYGGGDITLNVNGGRYKKIFGGNNLYGEINGNVTVNFYGGYTEEIYGGNNQGGTVLGTITVNIDSSENACTPHFYVENVYGGGNEAPYSHASGNYPEVNVKNGTVQENVYGGGYGSSATVTGSPAVTVGVSNTEKRALVLGNIFGGGNAAPVSGNTDVKILYNSYIKGNVYGGGNAATVSGDTKVVVGN